MAAERVVEEGEAWAEVLGSARAEESCERKTAHSSSLRDGSLSTARKTQHYKSPVTTAVLLQNASSGKKKKITAPYPSVLAHTGFWDRIVHWDS